MNILIHRISMSALVLVLVFNFACVQQKKTEYDSYGASIDLSNSQSLSQALDGQSFGDTVAVKFVGTVVEVCQAKGCWMTLVSDRKVRVTFKDYGFFVPKDITGREVMVEGVAIVSELSEEMARHYAEDAGKEYTEDMKREISIIASGVLVAKAAQL